MKLNHWTVTHRGSKDFDYIILSAEYVKKIINEIKIIMISNELNQHLYIFSIILNFFKNIY